MWDLIVEEIPYMIAAMLAAPIVLVVSALIIGKAERPVRSASIFVLGAVILDFVFAAVILALYEAAGVDAGSGDASAWIDTILGALFLLLGIKAMFSHPSDEERASQRRRIERVAVAGTGGLLLAGVVVQLLNADALAVFATGLKEIATTDPYPAVFVTLIVVVAVFILVMLVLYHLPVDMYVVSPEKAGNWMRAMSVAPGSQPGARDRRGVGVRRVLPLRGALGSCCERLPSAV
jgi:threonine/homoserine/homoserine lactone efflux protein